jgi:tripartite motif-containing protein 71
MSMTRGMAFVLCCVLAPAACLGEDWQFLFKWGSFGSGDGQFNAPAGIAADYSGTVYVADSGNHRIQVFDGETGAFLDKWGTFGSGDGQFDNPTAVALSCYARAYVADTGNDRVQSFMTDGTFVTQWGSHGTGPSEFDGPRGVACDWNGNVYVADSGNHRIQKFSASGDFLREWGSQGSAPEMLDSPGGLAFLCGYGCSWQAIAVADEMNNRVQIFDLEGTLIQVIDFFSLSRPRGVCAVDEPGGCFVCTSMCIADTEHDRIVPEEASPWGSYGVGDGQFDSPQGVASAYTYSGRLVWVADTGNHRIQLFDFPCAIDQSSWAEIKAKYR